jgi:hypothetical protein
VGLVGQRERENGSGKVCWAVGFDAVLGQTGYFGPIPFPSLFFFLFTLFCFPNFFITFAYIIQIQSNQFLKISKI